MKVISNTLKLEIGTWDDPGDYPSGAGAGPLPSYSYPECVSGQIVVEVEESDIPLGLDAEDVLREDPGTVPHGIHGVGPSQWEIVKREGRTFTLEVSEDENLSDVPSPEEDDGPEPDDFYPDDPRDEDCPPDDEDDFGEDVPSISDYEDPV